MRRSGAPGEASRSASNARGTWRLRGETPSTSSVSVRHDVARAVEREASAAERRRAGEHPNVFDDDHRRLDAARPAGITIG